MKLKKINEEHYVVENNDGIITHSTQPLEIIHTSGVTMTNPPMGFINIIELPLSEVKELLGVVDVERKYTEKDMMEAMLKICEYYADSVGSGGVLDGYKTANQIIQSLQPKTEWEVEFINGKLTLI